jgi:hypothetical protein
VKVGAAAYHHSLNAFDGKQFGGGDAGHRNPEVVRNFASFVQVSRLNGH